MSYTDYKPVMNILQIAGAGYQIIRSFIFEEIDIDALMLMRLEHYDELGCPRPITNNVMNMVQAYKCIYD